MFWSYLHLRVGVVSWGQWHVVALIGRRGHGPHCMQLAKPFPLPPFRAAILKPNLHGQRKQK